MSARVGFEDAETVLASMMGNTSNTQGSLSVDLPEGDLYVKGQCSHKVSFTDVCSEGCKPCGHDVNILADVPREWIDVPAKGKRPAYQKLSDGYCYQCAIDAPVAELSRHRINRRCRRAKALLVGRSPVEYHTDPSDPKKKIRTDGKVSKNKGKWYPVSACGIVPLIGSLTLQQRLSGRIDRHGVFRCGSVWTCTSCAQRISVPRANQIRQVYDAARAAGYRAMMFTGTIPHDLETGVRLGIKRCKAALRGFFGHSTAVKRLKELGYVGHVVVIEITYPKKDAKYNNGAHVHWHAMVVFTQIEGKEHTTAGEDMIRATVIKSEMFRFWVAAAMKAGAPRAPSQEHGFDVSVAWSSTYLSKTHEKVRGGDSDEPSSDRPKPKAAWGIEAELTRAHLKENSKKGRTPFELLDDTDDQADGDEFLEYASATFGLSQMEWSRSGNDIRKLFLGENYRDVSDVIAALEEPEYVMADEAPTLEADPVIEECEIKADDCWRARKYGRNALDRAIASVDRVDSHTQDADGRFQLMTLERALREEKFIVDHVTPAWTEEEVPVTYPKGHAKAGEPVIEIVRDLPGMDWTDSVVLRGANELEGDWCKGVDADKMDEHIDRLIAEGNEYLEFITYGPRDGWEYRTRQVTTIINHPKRYEVRYLVGEAAMIARQVQLDQHAQEPTQEPQEGWQDILVITEDDIPF